MPPSRAVPDPVSCSGSPRELGRQQGEALRDSIRQARPMLADLEAFRLAGPRGLPFPMFLRMAEGKATKVWRRTVARTIQPLDDRVRGIAEGAGVPERTVHLLHLLEPLMADLRAHTDAPPPGACTAVAVGTARSASGEPVIARNFDYLPVVQPLYTLRESLPRDGYRSLDFTLAPLAGAIDGMNEKGLCITLNYAFATDTGEPAGTITLAIAEALRQCADVEEACAFLTQRPRWGGGILMLVDAGGGMASLELSNQRASVRHSDDGTLCHTNRFHAQELRAVEIPEGTRYTARAPEPLRGVEVHRSSAQRDRRLRELLGGMEAIGTAELGRLLGDHGSDGEPSRESVCLHSDYWTTTATLRWYPAAPRVEVAFDTACRAKWRSFTPSWSDG